MKPNSFVYHFRAEAHSSFNFIIDAIYGFHGDVYGRKTRRGGLSWVSILINEKDCRNGAYSVN